MRAATSFRVCHKLFSYALPGPTIVKIYTPFTSITNYIKTTFIRLNGM